MRRFGSHLTPLIAAVGQPDDSSTLPACTDSGGADALGGSTTEQTYIGPWDDDFYGPALMFGGGGDRR